MALLDRSNRERRVLRWRALQLIRLSRVFLRHIERLVSRERGDRLDCDACLRCCGVHADPPTVTAVLGGLYLSRLSGVAARFEIAGNARLKCQAHATIPEPAADVPTFLNRSEQRLARADTGEDNPALERSDQAGVVLARHQHGGGICPRLCAEEHKGA